MRRERANPVPTDEAVMIDRHRACAHVAPNLAPDFSRRAVISQMGLGFGGIALSHLLTSNEAQAARAVRSKPAASVRLDRGVLGETHFPAKVKRIIYLFMAGGPSQM